MEIYRKNPFDIVNLNDINFTNRRRLFMQPFFNYPNLYYEYKYRLIDVANMLEKHYTTIAHHRDNGLLKFNRFGKTSLYYITKMLTKTRQGRSSYQRWTAEEDKMVLQYKIPKDRTKTACKIRRCRLRKEKK
jgi:hypothetical protein